MLVVLNAVAIAGYDCGILLPGQLELLPSALPCFCYDVSNCTTGKIFNGKSLCVFANELCVYEADPTRSCQSFDHNSNDSDVMTSTTTTDHINWLEQYAIANSDGNPILVTRDCALNPQCVDILDGGYNFCYDLEQTCEQITGGHVPERCANTEGCRYVANSCISVEAPCTAWQSEGACESRNCEWDGTHCGNRPSEETSGPTISPALIAILSLLSAGFLLNLYARLKEKPEKTPLIPSNPPPKYTVDDTKIQL